VTAVLGLTEAVITITSFSLLTVFGAMLGARFYRGRPRGPISKFCRPPRKRASVKRPSGHAPWRGHAPWGAPGDRSAIYKRQPDNSWKRSGDRAMSAWWKPWHPSTWREWPVWFQYMWSIELAVIIMLVASILVCWLLGLWSWRGVL